MCSNPNPFLNTLLNYWAWEGRNQTFCTFPIKVTSALLTRHICDTISGFCFAPGQEAIKLRFKDLSLEFANSLQNPTKQSTKDAWRFP